MQCIFRRSIVSIFTSVVLICSLASASVSALGGGIGGRPANPDPSNPRSASIFVYTLAEGASKQDQVRISNSGDQPQTIELYAVDGTTTNTGSLACRQQVEAKNDVGSWVSLASSEVTLAPKQDTAVDFTVAVPTLATPGEHDGCLVFQQKNDEGQVTGNIRILTRQALRIAITVPGAIHKSVSLANFTVQQAASGITLGTTIANSGNVSADTNVQTTIRTVFGNTIYRNGGSYPVFGGKTLQLQFVDEKKPFWGGFYLAQATIQYDKRPGVFGLTDKIQLITLHGARHVIFVRPAPVVSIGTIVAVCGLGWFIFRRVRQRRQLRRNQREWESYAVIAGDTLETIALARHTSWQRLAKVNQLKPPYQLAPGQAIKVPARTLPRKSKKGE